MHWYHFVGLYVSGYLAFMAWDTFIGWGVWESGDHWNDEEAPAWFVALFWMVALPILLISCLGSKANKFKNIRRKRQKERKEKLQKEEEQKRRLRIKEEEDLRAIEEELEKEQFKNKR